MGLELEVAFIVLFSRPHGVVHLWRAVVLSPDADRRAGDCRGHD
jgi:hypothetical protein